MLSKRIDRWVLAALLMLLPAAGNACEWTDTDDTLRILSGNCALSEIAKSETIEVTGRIATATTTIRVERGATLVLDGAEFNEFRLLSTSEIRANLIAEAATLRILDISIQSYDPATGGPDTTMDDGRAFVRVDAFVDAEGQPANGRLEIERSRLSYLGYDSRYVDLGTYSSYGVSLKVRSEEDLQKATVNGHILNSKLSHNYRGFYSYGAQDFEIRDSEIHHNIDYGVDGHDDTDRLIVTGNLVYSNGGTGVICSRRCNKNIFADNEVYGNGANGIVLHDISTGGRILNNTVYDNLQDGIVVHDSQATLVFGNEVHGNRYGLRVFSGSAVTTVENNRFGSNAIADIFLKHGNLSAQTDLSDYSSGSKWNRQNIARHNSSRVWGTEIVGNRFLAPARIVARGAEFLRFIGNTYAAGASFDIRSSNNIELDGALAEGPLSYLLRAEPEGFADYRITAASGAKLSMTGFDRVTLAGNRSLAPIGPDFLVQIDGNEPSKLTLGTADRQDIRTGVLVDFPVIPVAGAATITGYKDKFAAEHAVTMNIRTDPLDGIRFRAFDQLCSIVEWTLLKRSFIAFGHTAVELNVPDDEPLLLRCLSFASE